MEKISPIIFENVSRFFKIGDQEIKAVDDVSFEILPQGFVVVVGPSGAGKTTLLNLLGGMDSPSSGSIIVNDKDIAKYSELQLNRYRRDEIGFVFQFYNLINNLTALENVELSTQLSKQSLDPLKVLEDVGLKDFANSFPSQLSGGQQQRVAIARALASRPQLLLCDEPTGALDTQTGQAILAYLQSACQHYQMTVVVITHNNTITKMADQVITIRNGKIESNFRQENPLSAYEIEW